MLTWPVCFCHKLWESVRNQEPPSLKGPACQVEVWFPFRSAPPPAPVQSLAGKDPWWLLLKCWPQLFMLKNNASLSPVGFCVPNASSQHSCQKFTFNAFLNILKQLTKTSFELFLPRKMKMPSSLIFYQMCLQYCI